MNIIDKNKKVIMVRRNLNEIPRFELPEGFSIQCFKPGDEHKWVEIQTRSDKYNKISHELYRNEFGDDDLTISRRQLFLLNSRREYMGTATAWFDECFDGQSFGRLHWVAILPEYQGMGLAKPLLSRTLQQLFELSHRNCYLFTSTSRIPAICLYRKFGFLPFIQDDADQDLWNQLQPFLKVQ